MVGLIVSSMPSVPAFINHVRGGAPPKAISFEPLSQRVKRKPNYRRGGAHMGLDDPSLLYSANGGHSDTGCEEGTDLEGHNGIRAKRGRLEDMDDRTMMNLSSEKRVGSL